MPAGTAIPRVAEAGQLPVDREESEEDRQVRTVRGVVAAGEIGLDVAAQALLERVGRVVAYAVQRPVERRGVEAVGGVGNGVRGQRRQFRGRGRRRVLLVEDRPVDGGALRVCGEEPVVVGESELPVDERPYITVEVDRSVPGEQPVHLFGAEVARQRRAFAGPGVADLGVVRHPAP